MPHILTYDAKRLSQKDAEFQKWARDIAARAQTAQDEADWRQAQKGVQKLLAAPIPK